MFIFFVWDKINAMRIYPTICSFQDIRMLNIRACHQHTIQDPSPALPDDIGKQQVWLDSRNRGDNRVVSYKSSSFDSGLD
jgi:hypothetical protein